MSQEAPLEFQSAPLRERRPDEWVEDIEYEDVVSIRAPEGAASGRKLWDVQDEHISFNPRP